MEVYRSIFILGIDVVWAEKQHFMALLAILTEAAASEEDRKPKKASNADIMGAIV
ncbi:hypothetical protein [Listeria monocytogenes]|uniref:hypothetical protein n=1 Tax=Listeria monocytogenes TaxID=1639 RepID=UPI0015E6D127|nr:hypothetical protein [Listeria monocytogenes]EKS8445844.1 hypothetical protein [Listeria monocytogenes]